VTISCDDRAAPASTTMEAYVPMKKHNAIVSFLALACCTLLASASTVGCGGGDSSSSSSGTSGSGFGCNLSLAGSQFCYVYTNLTSAQQMQEQQACTSQSGSVVSSCPSANLVGCCKVTMGGLGVNECYYFGTASVDQQACTMASGTWSTTM
jgi:hypothetical protein